MAENLGELVATAGLNIDPFEQSARVLQKQTKALNQQMKGMEAAFKGQGNSINGLSSKYKVLSQQVKNAEALAEKQTAEYKRQKAAIKDLSAATDAEKQSLLNAEAAMHKANAQVEILTQKERALRKELAMQSSSLVKAGTKMQEFGSKATSAGNKLVSAGRTMSAFSGAVAVGLGAAVKVAADLESELSNIEAVSGASAAEMTKFKDLAVELGASTKFSATEAAQGITELLKAGVSTTDVLNGGLSGALSLATAGEIGLADAAEIASTALNAFKDDNISVTQAADILAGAANASATDVGELKQSLQQVSAVAAGTGASFEETSTMLAVFAQNGLKGSDAGTSLKTMLMRLHPQTDKAWAEFERLGLVTTNVDAAMRTLSENGVKPLSKDQDVLMEQMHDLAESMAGPEASASKVKKEFNSLLEQSGTLQSAFYDTNGELRGMDEIAGILQEHLSGLTDEQRTAALTTMFGSDAVRGATIAYKEGAEGVQKMNKEMSKTTAAEVSAKKMDNLKGELEELKGSLETLAITSGETLIPFFKDMVKGAQNIVDSFNALDKDTQEMIMKIGLFAAAIGPATVAVGLFVKSVGSISSAAGLMTKGLGKLLVNTKATTSSVNLLSAGTVGMDKSVKTATKGIGAFGLRLNPVGLGITAVTAALAGGLIIWETWGKDAYKASQRTNQWGTDVGESADKALDDFQKFNVGSKVAMDDATQVTEEDALKISAAFKKMSDEVGKAGDEMSKKQKKAFENLPTYLQESGKKAYDEQVSANDKRTKLANENAKAMSQIYNKAAAEERNLTSDEQAMLLNMQKEFSILEVEQLGLTGKKKKQVMAVLNQDYKKLTKSQLEDSEAMLIGGMIDIQSEYDKNIKNINKLTKKGSAERQEMTKTENLKYEEQISSYATKYVGVMDEIWNKNKDYYTQQGITQDTFMMSVEANLQKYGLSLDGVRKKMEEQASSAKDSNELIAKSTESMTTEAVEANNQWNMMIYDPKTGEVTTNAPETVAKAIKSEDGWNQLSFILQHADLTSNAKSTVLDAVLQNEAWDNLSFDEKSALVEYDGSQEVITALDDVDVWNKQPMSIKKAIMEADTHEELTKALKDYGIWDLLPDPLKKELGLDNYDFIGKMNLSENMIVTYNGKEINLKKLLANNTDLFNKIKNGESVIVTYNGKKVDLKRLYADNKDLIDGMTEGKNTIAGYNKYPVGEKNMFIDTNASEVDAELQMTYDQWQQMLNTRSKKTLEIAYKTSGKGPSGPLAQAKGTDFHPGGLALVNDATSRKYRELITTPDGQSFIPRGKNVILDLPRGSSVLRGDKTAQLLRNIPHFADGTRQNLLNTKGMQVLSRMNTSNPISATKKNGQILDTNSIVSAIKENSDKNIQMLIEVVKAITGLTFDKDAILRIATDGMTDKTDLYSYMKRG
ncbi:phage tail tape measure protein [Listeria seeligeri]|uniref:phage tail tape measure protein n=1 Tax=Listeria seeligeri TaxID=1640 RepID=UPI0018892060|nr:phage tail tape measure protein [Listeria seeligeri]MBF2653967.1 phage tail tape measure protein [Listeria seeligeri]